MKLKSGKEVSGMYGTMNQVHPRNVSDHYDSDYMSGVDAIKKTVLNHYSSNDLAAGPYRGIVLKVLPPPTKEKSLFSFLNFWEDDVDLGPNYIIRVPELDSHIPEPDELEATPDSKDFAIIQSHNIYKAASQRVAVEDLAEVGDIVWVDVKNGEYTYLGKIKNDPSTAMGPGSGSGASGVPVGPDGMPAPGAYVPGGGKFDAPQYKGFLENKGTEGHFQGKKYSEYFSKVRARNMAPPTSATTPKLTPITHQHWDLSPRPENYRGCNSYIKTRHSSSNDEYPPRYKKGRRWKGYTKGVESRQDFAQILGEIKHIINKLGGGFYGGSWKARISAATGRGPLFSMHSNGTATDMHANTVYNHRKDIKQYEHNLEVMRNRKHWVQWLKMPREATYQYAGRTWEAKKISINAVRVPPGGTVYNHSRLEGIYFNLAECFEWFGAKGIGPWYSDKYWIKQKSKWDEMWHLDSRLTNGYVANRTMVGDALMAQNFRGYRTPAQKMRLPMMKHYSGNIWTGGAFSKKRAGRWRG